MKGNKDIKILSHSYIKYFNFLKIFKNVFWFPTEIFLSFFFLSLLFYSKTEPFLHWNDEFWVAAITTPKTYHHPSEGTCSSYSPLSFMSGCLQTSWHFGGIQQSQTASSLDRLPNYCVCVAFLGSTRRFS